MEPDQQNIGIHAVVTGRVQGVSFRWYTRSTARSLGVTGWIQNLPDGSVELVAEGTRKQLEQLLAWCQRGPKMARVDDVSTQWLEATGEFAEFLVRH